MNTNWLRLRLAFALVSLASGSVPQLFLFGPTSLAAVAPAQKQSSKETSSHHNRQPDKKGLTRPRAIPKSDAPQYSSGGGPTIRVALLTDVTTVSLGCASGLIVNRGPEGTDIGKGISGGSLRVELRQQFEPVASNERVASVFHVVVSYSHDSRVARNLADELKQRFFEPVSTTFDEDHNEYAVLIGRYPNRREAELLAVRLRKAGYQSLRILGDPDAERSVPPENWINDVYARAAKYRAQPGYTTTTAGHATVATDRI